MYFNLFKEDNNSKKKEKTPLNFEFENKNIDSLKKDDEIRILKKELKEKNITINLIKNNFGCGLFGDFMVTQNYFP